MNPPSTLGRRTFLVGAALTGGAGAVVGSSLTLSSAFADVPETRLAWRLAPDHWTSAHGHPARTHCRCSACVRHAANKIFVSLESATDPDRRAHHGCYCEPQSFPLPVTTWNSLFQDGHAVVLDRRTPAVAWLLAAGPPVTGVPPIVGPTPTVGARPSEPTSLPLHQAPTNAAAPASPIGLTSRTTRAAAADVIPLRRPVPTPSRTAAGRALDSSRSTRLTPPHSVSARPAAVRPVPAGSSEDLSLLAVVGVPVFGIATAVGAIVWWRRRGEESEPPPLAAA